METVLIEHRPDNTVATVQVDGCTTRFELTVPDRDASVVFVVRIIPGGVQPIVLGRRGIHWEIGTDVLAGDLLSGYGEYGMAWLWDSLAVRA